MAACNGYIATFYLEDTMSYWFEDTVTVTFSKNLTGILHAGLMLDNQILFQGPHPPLPTALVLSDLQLVLFPHLP